MNTDHVLKICRLVATRESYPAAWYWWRCRPKIHNDLKWRTYMRVSAYLREYRKANFRAEVTQCIHDLTVPVDGWSSAAHLLMYDFEFGRMIDSYFFRPVIDRVNDDHPEWV